MSVDRLWTIEGLSTLKLKVTNFSASGVATALNLMACSSSTSTVLSEFHNQLLVIAKPINDLIIGMCVAVVGHFDH